MHYHVVHSQLIDGLVVPLALSGLVEVGFQLTVDFREEVAFEGV